MIVERDTVYDRQMRYDIYMIVERLMGYIERVMI